MPQPVIDVLKENCDIFLNLLYMLGSAIIGYWLGVSYSKRRWKKDIIYTFETAFTDFTHELNKHGRLFPKSAIDKFRTAHDIAFEKFIMVGLSRRKTERLKIAWREFQTEADQYYNAPFKITFEPAKTEFRECIERLMKKIRKL